MAAMATSMSSTFLVGAKMPNRVNRARSVSRASKMVVRAGDGDIVKKDRSATPQGDKLYFASEQSLSYLDGTLPGDFGFDPLGLSDPEGEGGYINPSWLAYAEIIHCRWAMLGAAGCFAPEFLGKLGVIPESTGLVWFKNGVVPMQGTFDYWCDPFTLFFVEVVLMSFAEHRRIQDYRNPGSMKEQYFLGLETALGGSRDPAYPGGQFFNMFNLGSDNMDKMKLKEVKNGRLAMLAMLGFFVQAMVTGEGPAGNLSAHVSDGLANNFLTNFAAIGGGF